MSPAGSEAPKTGNPATAVRTHPNYGVVIHLDPRGLDGFIPGSRRGSTREHSTAGRHRSLKYMPATLTEPFPAAGGKRGLLCRVTHACWSGFEGRCV